MARTFNLVTSGGLWTDDVWSVSGRYPGDSATDVDTVNIGTTATKVVTYNCPSLLSPLGTVTIGGVSYPTSELNFSTGLTTLMSLGSVFVDLYGILRLDLSASAYLATLDFAISGSDTGGIKLRTAAAQLILKGNPTYYGAAYHARIAADFTMPVKGGTIDSGTAFTLTGDFSAWPTGAQILVHRGTTYASATDDFAVVTLDASPTFAGGVSTITGTVTEGKTSTQTFYRYGDVLMQSRSIRFTKNGASVAPGNFNTNRPGIANQTNPTYLTNQAIIQDVDFLGVAGIGFNNAKMSNCVLRNGGNLLSQYASQVDIDNQIVAHTNGHLAQYASNISLDNAYLCGLTYTNHPLLYDGPLVEGSNIHYFGNSAGYGLCVGLVGTLRNLYHYSNAGGLRPGAGTSAQIINGSIGKDSDGNIKANASDYTFDLGAGGVFLTTHNLDVGTVTLQNSNGTTQGRIQCQNFNKTADLHAIYSSWGEAITGTQGAGGFPAKRAGGGDILYRITSYSNLGTARFFRMPLKPIWVTSGEKTLSLWVYHDYGAPITNANIYVMVDYDIAATTIAQETSTTTNIANTTWTALEVTFTPAVNGWATPVLYLTLYHATGKVYVDQLIEVA